MIQFFLALFGLTALAMMLSKNEKARKWAPLVGLFLSEPMWFIYAFSSEAWGIVVMSLAYSCVFAWGAWNQWKK